MLTSIYGWQPGKTAPISGTNEDDFSLATQTILWEYQQQLRKSPTVLTENSYGIRADNYLRSIKGRPAELCYNWILEQMKSHARMVLNNGTENDCCDRTGRVYCGRFDFP